MIVLWIAFSPTSSAVIPTSMRAPKDGEVLAPGSLQGRIAGAEPGPGTFC